METLELAPKSTLSHTWALLKALYTNQLGAPVARKATGEGIRLQVAGV